MKQELELFDKSVYQWFNAYIILSKLYKYYILFIYWFIKQHELLLFVFFLIYWQIKDVLK